ncbi:hypothetical protein SCA6_013755 [Theobroma cacao]
MYLGSKLQATKKLFKLGQAVNRGEIFSPVIKTGQIKPTQILALLQQPNKIGSDWPLGEPAVPPHQLHTLQPRPLVNQHLNRGRRSSVYRQGPHSGESHAEAVGQKLRIGEMRRREEGVAPGGQQGEVQASDGSETGWDHEQVLGVTPEREGEARSPF